MTIFPKGPYTIRRTDVELKNLVAAHEQMLRAQFAGRSTVALIANIESLNSSNIVLLSPIGQAFRSVSRAYPAFENSLLDWQSQIFDAYGTAEAFVREWKEQGVAKSAIPVWLIGAGLPSNSRVALRNVGTKSISIPRWRVISILVRKDLSEPVLEYLEQQVVQFGDMSFLDVVENLDISLDGNRFTPSMVPIDDGLRDADIFGAMPPRAGNESRLPLIADALERAIEFVLAGKPIDVPLSITTLLRPPFGFSRSYHSARISPTAAVLDPELEDKINGLRAHLIRLLGWPNAFSIVELQLKIYLESLQRTPLAREAEYSVSKELSAYLEEMQMRYPVIRINPMKAIS